jgi:hypothetical protein
VQEVLHRIAITQLIRKPERQLAQPITKAMVRQDQQHHLTIQDLIHLPRQDLRRTATIPHRNAVRLHLEAAIRHRPEAHRRVVIPPIQETAHVAARVQEAAIPQVVRVAVVRRAVTRQVIRAAVAVHRVATAPAALVADAHLAVLRAEEAEAAADAK